MASTNLWRATFQVVKLNPAGSRSAYAYRREMRTAMVQATNAAAVQAALNSNITGLGVGESIEIISTMQETVGTEGVGQVLS